MIDCDPRGDRRFHLRVEVLRALKDGDATGAQVANALDVHASSGLTRLGFAEAGPRLTPVGGRGV